MKERIIFFGSTIDLLTMSETLQLVEQIIAERKVVQHVVINVAKLVLMQKDENLLRAVNSCGIINADGQGIVWGAKLLGISIPERVAGIDLMMNLVKLSSEKGYKLFLLGATQEVIETVVKKWRKQYPNITIAGYRNGYFTNEQEKGVVKEIAQSGADILFVAMSSPKKEYFLNKYLKDFNVPFLMGVGGSFDVVAGKTRRAPLWMQKAGLEWFYRFLCEPRRMWKRYLVTNSIFAWMIIKASLRKDNT